MAQNHTERTNGDECARRGKSHLLHLFNNLTGVNIQDKRELQAYLAMMFHDFPKLTYGEIELWEDGKLIDKGNIRK